VSTKSSPTIAVLKERTDTTTIDVGPFSEEDLARQQTSSGIWKSEVSEYKGYGQFISIRLPANVTHIIANFRPLGDEATKVMIRVLFLNVVGQEAYAFIQALDLKAYLDGIGSRPWTEKFRYQIDLWLKCEPVTDV
jgi:hypothetical protein